MPTSVSVPSYGGFENILYILLIWLITLPLALGFVMQNVFRMGIYHEIRWPQWLVQIIQKFNKEYANKENSEAVHKKIWKILSCYLSLTVPLLVTFIIIIKNTSYVSNISMHDAVSLSAIITLMVLVIIRFLANPCKTIINLMPNLHVDNDDNSITYREFILSFFYSFILSAIILILIITSYVIWFNINVDLGIQFSPIEFLSVLVRYLLFLIVAAVLGEILLMVCGPENCRET